MYMSLGESKLVVVNGGVDDSIVYHKFNNSIKLIPVHSLLAHCPDVIFVNKSTILLKLFENGGHRLLELIVFGALSNCHAASLVVSDLLEIFFAHDSLVSNVMVNKNLHKVRCELVLILDNFESVTN